MALWTSQGPEEDIMAQWTTWPRGNGIHMIFGSGKIVGKFGPVQLTVDIHKHLQAVIDCTGLDNNKHSDFSKGKLIGKRTKVVRLSCLYRMGRA